MRVRIAVRDPRVATTQDVGIECAPEHLVGDVLDVVDRALGVSGTPTVDGAPVRRDQVVAESAIRAGAVLDYANEIVPICDDDGPLLRVVSGQDTGRTVPLGQRPVVLGRGAGADVDLADGDVSRAHLSVRWTAQGAEVTDIGGANGTRISRGGSFAGVDPIPRHQPVVLPAGEQVQIGGSRLALEAPEQAAAVLTPDEQGRLLLNRAPRHRQPAPSGTVDLPAIPSVPPPTGLAAVVSMALLPIIPAILMAVVSSPVYLLITAASPITAGLTWWLTKRADRKRREANAADYAGKLAQARQRALAHLDDEDAHLRREWPDPETVVRAGTRRTIGLWQRRAADDDWLRLRLGTATRPSTLQVRGSVPDEGWPPPVITAAPCGVDLATEGAVGITGPDDAVAPSLTWVLAQAAVLHGPDELGIAVVAPGRADLAWVRWLPHLGGASVSAAWDHDQVDALVGGLLAQAAAMRERVAHAHSRTRPHTLVVLVGTADLARRTDVAELIEQGVDLGFRFVCVDRARAGLPSRCTAVLDLDAGTRLRVSGQDELVIAPDRVDQRQAVHLAQRLAPLAVVGGGPDAGFPDVVRLAELMPDTTAEAIAAGWRASPQRTEVAVGLDSSGPVTVDIASKHGPHGLIVGASGSGKSEFLITLLAALAAANSPEMLNFLFVDYKGSATFKDLRALPHMVGEVSNLSSSPARVLGSLDAELTRRETLFAQAKAANINEYRLRAAADPALPGLARLVVVIEEFGELTRRNDKAVGQLVSITSKGRSSGVHLILATQSPRDISDAIANNCQLRVCLRVETAADSDRAIKHPDAASIPSAQRGRAFMLRAGALRQVQPAWSAAPAGGAVALPARAVPLHWDDRGMPDAKSPERKGLHTDLHDLVAAITKAAADHALEPVHRPWLDPLPDIVALAELTFHRHRIPLGLRDEPMAQRQDEFTMPLGVGNLLIAGGAQSGRTTALRAIATGLARANAPREAQFHVVDGARGLIDLAGFPHCGNVVQADETWRVDRLLHRLAATVRERLDLLAEHGVATLDELWSADPAAAPPHLVLLVDGADVIGDGGPREERFRAMLQDGQRVGLTACVTARETAVNSRLLKSFDHRLCLRMPDNNRVDTLGLPHRSDVTALPPGRALWSVDGTEVQLPAVARDLTGLGQRDAVRVAVAEAKSRWADEEPAALRVDALPRSIGHTAAADLPGKPAGRSVLFGVAGDELAAYWVAPAIAGRVLTVSGPPRSGRSTAACSMAISLCRQGMRVVMVCSKVTDVHARAIGEGVDVVGPDQLGALLGAGVDAVVVDDAESIQVADADVLALSGPGGPLLIGVIKLDTFANRYTASPLVKVIASSRSGIVLSPGRGEYLGVRFGMDEVFSGPAGRGYFVVDGDCVLGQAPLPD